MANLRPSRAWLSAMVEEITVLDLQVHRIRHLAEMGNGAILVCNRLENAEAGSGRIALQMPGFHMPAIGQFHVGQLMRVSGKICDWKNPRDGRTEKQIRVTHWFPIMPSRGNWAQLVANSPHFHGIGQAFANHAADRLGDRLLDAVAEGDVVFLLACCPAFPPEMARSLGRLWASWCRDTLAEWLSRFQLPTSALPHLDAAYCGCDVALRRLNADPYRLLAFGTSWRKSDSIAAKRFQVAKDDPRRLHGAVIHVLQKRYMAGDTVVAEPDLRKYVANLLHSDDAASSALLLTFRNGGFVRFGDRQFQLRGVWAKDTLNARSAPPQPP